MWRIGRASLAPSLMQQGKSKPGVGLHRIVQDFGRWKTRGACVCTLCGAIGSGREYWFCYVLGTLP
jgi:hypothetical protein